MTDQVTYDFALDRWTPQTLPMARLCQYLEKLALLFGSKEQVHFDMVRKGSAVSQMSVDRVALDSVQARVGLLGSPDAPKDVQNLQRDINRMLQVDGCVGTLKIKGGATIYRFLGRKTPLAEEVIVHEFGEVEGELIRVGGKDDSVPVWIQGLEGSVYKCTASKSVARELAPLIFAEPIRVSGNGKWRRTQDRVWILEEFEIKSWERLKSDDLQEVVETFRAIEGSKWNEMEDPQAELRRLRSDE
jgi:hypothetical protein